MSFDLSRLTDLPLPTRRLLLIGAAAAFIFPISSTAAVLADIVLIGLVWVDWRRTKPVELERIAPARLALGEGQKVVIRVTGPAQGETNFVVTDDVGPGLERVSPGAPKAVKANDDFAEDTSDHRIDWRAAGHTEPHTSVEVSYEIVARERGSRLLGSMYQRVRSPWGLVWRQWTVPASHPVLILPGTSEHKRFRMLSLRNRLRESGLHRIRERGAGQAFESLRDYMRGDDPRTIDWKATARRDHVMIRQYEAERSQNLLIAIDAGRLMAEEIGDRTRLDYALSAALLLTDVAKSYGDRVGLMVFNDQVRRFIPPRRHALSKIAEELTSVEPRLVEPNYPLAFTVLGKGLKRRSLVVLFTDLIDGAASKTLVAQLGRSARSHVTLAVTLRNPALLETAAKPVRDEHDLYLRTATEELLQARQFALASMRRSGVMVLDTPPREAIAEAASQYMEVKRRGLV